MVTWIFYLEKELGVFIDENYPLMKFYIQIDELQAHWEREKEDSDRLADKTDTMGR